MKTKVITARIDEHVSIQIEYLKKHLGIKTTTNILSKAINCLYDNIKQQDLHKSPFELLEELDLIGCIEDADNLSANYKNELNKSLNMKHSLYKKTSKKRKYGS